MKNRHHSFASAIAAVLLALGAAGFGASASAAPVLQAKQTESSTVRKAHEEIIKAYGVYEDQALQDYVSEVGQRVAKQSDMPDAEFKFVVLDEESINAFTTGCCYIYVHRGLLTHLNSEAELASVLGHEIGHVTAKHPQKRQTRGVLASIGAMAAAIATGSGAVADLANLGANAWLQGYGRENELEADRLGLKSATKAGYRPEAMGEVFDMFRRGERFGVHASRLCGSVHRQAPSTGNALHPSCGYGRFGQFPPDRRRCVGNTVHRDRQQR